MPAPPKQDVLPDPVQLRSQLDEMLAAMLGQYERYNAVIQSKFTIDAQDGHSLGISWFSKGNAASDAAIIYIHGGGRIAGNPEIYTPLIHQYVHHSEVSFLAVRYRLAPEVQAKQQTEDVLSALDWLIQYAEDLGINKNKIAINASLDGLTIQIVGE